MEGTFKVFFDGASRGNPGLAGAGAFVLKPNGERVDYVRYLGPSLTNNHAEYEALIMGLEGCQQLGASKVEAFGDSMLVCNQVAGAWKVKVANLMPLAEKAKKLAASFASFSIKHVYRSENSKADALANAAVDSRSFV